MVCGLLLATGVLEVVLRVHNPFETRVIGDKIVLLANRTYEYKNDLSEKLDEKIDRMLEEYKANLKKEYPPNFFEVKRSKRKPSGWETYVYPTWKGLRVLY